MSSSNGACRYARTASEQDIEESSRHPNHNEMFSAGKATGVVAVSWNRTDEWDSSVCISAARAEVQHALSRRA